MRATPNDDLVAAILAVADNKTLDVQTHYKPDNFIYLFIHGKKKKKKKFIRYTNV